MSFSPESNINFSMEVMTTSDLFPGKITETPLGLKLSGSISKWLKQCFAVTNSPCLAIKPLHRWLGNFIFPTNCRVEFPTSLLAENKSKEKNIKKVAMILIKLNAL